MRFSSGVIAAIAAPMAAMAFLQPMRTAKNGAFTQHNRQHPFNIHSDNKSLERSEAVRLQMAFKLEEGQTSNMFDGPLQLTKDRDACGVGFIANTNEGGETNRFMSCLQNWTQ